MDDTEAIVARVDDFAIDGAGSSGAWERATWLPLVPVKGSAVYRTRVKILYSQNGIYCLFDCEDRMITSTGLADFQDLWNEDVVEAFFWPDEAHHLYLEYEISPLGAELPLLVPNDRGTFMGWLPFHYEGDRRAQRATAVHGGPKAAGAKIHSWSVEFFLPFALLKGLCNTPPVAGSRWRANFTRIDYDTGEPTLFSWSQSIEASFHELNQFGTIVFQ